MILVVIEYFYGIFQNTVGWLWFDIVYTKTMLFTYVYHYTQIKIIEAVIYGLECILPEPTKDCGENDHNTNISNAKSHDLTDIDGLVILNTESPSVDLCMSVHSTPTSLYDVVSSWSLSLTDDAFTIDDVSYEGEDENTGIARSVIGTFVSNWTLSDEILDV
jgi:hypothetical protein